MLWNLHLVFASERCNENENLNLNVSLYHIFLIFLQGYSTILIKRSPFVDGFVSIISSIFSALHSMTCISSISNAELSEN